MPVTEPTQLGEFTILEKIGQGAMGAVYKARQSSLGRIVALKLLPARFAADADFVARFKHEASAAAVLNHPHIVQIYAAGEDKEAHYFAMEYVEGESLGVRLRRKGRIEPREAIAVAVYVARALDYAWKKAGVIHRDIKPDNIFLSDEGAVKLGDLGLAKVLGTEGVGLTQTGMTMGTPNYVSPEQATGKKEIDFRADIYSLGCTIFHVVCGEPPYRGDTAMAVMVQHITRPAPKIQDPWPECPLPLIGLLDRMLCKNPDGRYDSYEELLQHLGSVGGQLERPVLDGPGAKSREVLMPGEGDSSAPKTNSAATPVAKRSPAKRSSARGSVGKFAALVVGLMGIGIAIVGQQWKWTVPAPVAARAMTLLIRSAVPVRATLVSFTHAPATPGPATREPTATPFGRPARKRAAFVASVPAPTLPATPMPAAPRPPTPLPPKPDPVSPAPTPAVVAPVSSAGLDSAERWKKSINLLPSIDVPADTVDGKFATGVRGLASSPSGLCKLELPYRPPLEYDFRIAFTCLSGTNEACQMLAREGRAFEWLMGPNSARMQVLRGKFGEANPTMHDFHPVTNRRYISIVQVRNDGVKAFVDGLLISEWKTNYRDMDSKEYWSLRDNTRLGVGAHTTLIVFDRIDVLEITGSGSLIRQPKTAPAGTH